MMTKTYLGSAAALALSMAFAGAAAAADNAATAHEDQIVLQDLLNGSLNDNGSNNVQGSGNDNDQIDLDVSNGLNGSLNDNGSNNVQASNNDNDLIDLDAEVQDAFNDKSTNTVDASANWTDDNSVNLSNIAVVVSEQYLDGLAAAVDMQAERGNVNTGDVVYGAETNKLAAGNITDSLNTGAGSVALAASGIQANGTFQIGN